MIEYLDQESKLERRALRKANELFLKRLQAEWRRVERNRRARDRYNGNVDFHDQQVGRKNRHDIADYDGSDDFSKSIDEAYRVIRERVAAGGKGWTPP